MYYFTFSKLGVPKSLIIWDEGQISEYNIKAQKTGFSFFSPSLKASSSEKAVGLCHYSFIIIVADVLRPLSESKGGPVKCKFNLSGQLLRQKESDLIC